MESKLLKPWQYQILLIIQLLLSIILVNKAFFVPNGNNLPFWFIYIILAVWFALCIYVDIKSYQRMKW